MIRVDVKNFDRNAKYAEYTTFKVRLISTGF